MDTIDKILLEWSFRCEKGYPDLSNEEDILIIETLLSNAVGEEFKLNERKHPFEYLNSTAQEVGKELIKQLNLEDSEIVAHSKNRIIIFTDRKRQDIFKELANLGYEKGTIRGSSGGGFRTLEGVEIIHKNITSPGNAGLDNEYIVVSKINEYIAEVGELTVIIKALGNGVEVKYEGITGAKDVGKATGDNKKADILLLTKGADLPISIKKDGQFRWSSAMRTHGDVFHKVIGGAFKGERDDLKLIPDEDNPRVLRMMNPKNNLPYGRVFVTNVPGVGLKEMAFGSDNSKIIQRTFSDSDFSIEGNTLTIKATNLYLNVEDFEDKDQPIIQFERNSSKATSQDPEKYTGRGITIRTVPISVIPKPGSKANTLTVDWNDIK